MSSKCMMELLLRQFVLWSMVYFINSQFPVEPEKYPGIPDKCHASIEFVTAQCCVLPPFFARDVAKKCGAINSVVSNDLAYNITYRRRNMMDRCGTWKCILSEYKLITPQNIFDYERYFAHLDRWVELNPEFSEVMAKVKARCLELMKPFLPLEVCEFKRLHFCIRQSIDLDCPVVKNTETCIKQKEFFEECREFYYRK